LYNYEIDSFPKYTILFDLDDVLVQKQKIKKKFKKSKKSEKKSWKIVVRNNNGHSLFFKFRLFFKQIIFPLFIKPALNGFRCSNVHFWLIFWHPVDFDKQKKWLSKFRLKKGLNIFLWSFKMTHFRSKKNFFWSKLLTLSSFFFFIFRF